MVVSLHLGVEKAACFKWLQDVSFKEPGTNGHVQTEDSSWGRVGKVSHMPQMGQPSSELHKALVLRRLRLRFRPAQALIAGAVGRMPPAAAGLQPQALQAAR